jgi:GNAT superfamily N-acetyltransferase
MGAYTICPGAPHLPEGLDPLASEADREGIRNVRTLLERWKDGTERFDRAGESVLVAVAAHTVIGVGGLSQCPTVSGALRVRRFYVSPDWRRRGVAGSLADRLVESGFTYADLLTCNAAASDAAPVFWEAMGFEPVTTEGVTHTLRRT